MSSLKLVKPHMSWWNKAFSEKLGFPQKSWKIKTLEFFSSNLSWQYLVIQNPRMCVRGHILESQRNCLYLRGLLKPLLLLPTGWISSSIPYWRGSRYLTSSSRSLRQTLNCQSARPRTSTGYYIQSWIYPFSCLNKQHKLNSLQKKILLVCL